MQSDSEVLYYVCCRDGARRTSDGNERKRRRAESCKLPATACVSRMTVTKLADGKIDVIFITAHTNHNPTVFEEKFLPLPQSVREEVADKLHSGIPKNKILKGIMNFSQVICNILLTFRYSFGSRRKRK